ncbi:MAG: hypothetical protein ACYDDF_03595 [Thermoplasmatota archaeon]
MRVLFRMGLVQFREDEETLQVLRDRGINPNLRARELLEAHVRALRAEERARRLERYNIRGPDPVSLVREDRDRGHREEP